MVVTVIVVTVIAVIVVVVIVGVVIVVVVVADRGYTCCIDCSKNNQKGLFVVVLFSFH